jgi:ferric-dicitrate binding protein FerR (iron transport regulator)
MTIHSLPMSEDFDWPLVERYLSGDCTREEARTFEEWLSVRPARRRELGVVREAWQRAAHNPVEHRWDAALPRVLARVGLEGASSSPPVRRTPRISTVTKPKRLPVRALMRIAAVLLIGTGAVFTWRYVESNASDGSAIPMREYVTARSQRAEVRLDDGTRVTLAPESRLRVATDIRRGPRTVYLDGTALFVVTHNEDRPFLVNVGRAVAEDLGTQFVVRAYAKDGTIDVAVIEGKVALRPEAAKDDRSMRGVALTHGQVGHVESSGLIGVSSDVDLTPYTAWTRGHLTFQRTPLVDVQREIERWYDVRVEWSDTTLSRVPVTASFSDEPVDEVLATLARLLDVRYTRNGSTALFITEGASR